MLAIAALLLLQDVPQFPPHYAPTDTICPVGGEAFKAPSLMHYSTFGSLPDGQPIGSVGFPILLPECPGNGLVVYEEFKPDAVAKLTPLLAGAAYKAMRGRETAYYRAHWIAGQLGQADTALWLLLNATWETKNDSAGKDRADRYGAAFVEAVRARPANSKDLQAVALRARAANALRELKRFDEAEALRASIAIDPGASGGDAEEAAAERKGWSAFLRALAGPIARRDASRYPIDMMPDRQAAFRCLEREFPAPEQVVQPLTPFETSYCARPQIDKEVIAVRKLRG